MKKDSKVVMFAGLIRGVYHRVWGAIKIPTYYLCCLSLAWISKKGVLACVRCIYVNQGDLGDQKVGGVSQSFEICLAVCFFTLDGGFVA